MTSDHRHRHSVVGAPGGDNWEDLIIQASGGGGKELSDNRSREEPAKIHTLSQVEEEGEKGKQKKRKKGGRKR